MKQIERRRVITPAGIELTLEAEKYVQINENYNLLSIGCGTGEMESYLALKYKCSVLGVDINPEFIKTAKAKETANLKFEIANGEKLDLPGESFHIIYISGALANFFEKGSLEIQRLLKPSGTLILIEPVYREGVLPFKAIESWTKKRNIYLLNLLTEESITNRFRELGFWQQHSKTYFETIWWEDFFNEQRSTLFLKDEEAIYDNYRNNIGIGLFIYQKVGKLTFDI